MGKHSPSPSPPGVYDTVPHDWVQTTARIRPDLHVALEAVKARTGKSLNRLLNEAIENSLTPPGGAARIAKMRKRLTTRTDPARAATAYLLGYLGKSSEARRHWPWSGRFTVKPGNLDDLAMAGALAALAIDQQTGGAAWGKTSAPSGA